MRSGYIGKQFACEGGGRRKGGIGGDTLHWMGKEDIPATQTPAPPTYIGFPYFVAAAFFFLSQDEEKGPF